MENTIKKLSRENVLQFISKSASYGNLGLFIGAGFSKAVLNTKSNIALSWGELLAEVAKEIKVNYKEIRKDGISYPEIATQICEEYSKLKEIKYSEALLEIKQKIANITSWYPDDSQREIFSPYLRNLNSSWIITTNYDLAIESILTGDSVTLGPNDSFTAHANVTPIFHLHGTRINPDEIIIAQEDYVGLFRPNEYRQIKLALMIKESTVVILGYGLGDVNVLTALDWSKNVFNKQNNNYPNEVIQIVRKDNPKNTPYRDKNSIIIFETKSLPDFFEEYLLTRKEELEKEENQKSSLKKIDEVLKNPKKSKINEFIDDQKFRTTILKALSKYQNDLISGFMLFASKCVDETWVRAKPSGAFYAYAQNLELTLDILVSFSLERMPPALFQMLAYNLQRVGYFIGSDIGKSYDAHEIWKKRKNELSSEMMSELRNFSSQHGYSYLYDLCK